jgi:hypothetical protein
VVVIPIGYMGFSGKRTVSKKKRIVKEGPKKGLFTLALTSPQNGGSGWQI